MRSNAVITVTAGHSGAATVTGAFPLVFPLLRDTTVKDGLTDKLPSKELQLLAEEHAFAVIL